MKNRLHFTFTPKPTNVAQRQEARAALGLSWAEIGTMFLKRTAISSLVMVPIYPRIQQFSARIVEPILGLWHLHKPEGSKALATITKGDMVMDIHRLTEHAMGPTNEQLLEDTKKWLNQKREFIPLAIAGGLAVTLGVIFTAGSIARYRKEQRFVEKQYAEKLASLPPDAIIPPAPTREDMEQLRGWRNHIKSQQRAGDVAAGVGAVSTAASVAAGMTGV